MILVCALVGLAVGSVLNWAGDFLPRFSSDAPAGLKPPSRPVFALWHGFRSLTFARGSSRQSICCQAVAVELFTALLFAYLWQRCGPSWQWLSLASVCSFFLLVAIIDLRYRRVLDVMIYPAAIVALLLHVVSPGGNWRAALVGGVLGLSLFLVTALIRPGSLGGGDIKLATLIGLMVGFPEVLWALMVGIVAGGITALLLVISPRWELESQIPYAPFLCLGAVIALLYNPIPLLLP